MTHIDAAAPATVGTVVSIRTEDDDEAAGLRLYESLRAEARARVRAQLMKAV